ncbi:MAG: AMP-binding protein [Desulfocucumaceae bacterium]
MTQSVGGFLAAEIAKNMEEKPDFPILTFENGEYPEEVLTYGDIFENGCRMAHALLGNGIGQGDTFAVVMRNHPEFVYCMLAASMTGAVMVPVDPRSKGDKLQYQLSDSGAKGIIFANELADQVEPVLRSLPGLKVIGVIYKPGFDSPVRSLYPSINDILSEPCPGPVDRPKSDPNLPLEIIYTSGTTGNPKGVRVAESRLATYGMLAKMVWQYREDDILYTGLSFTHGNAQAVSLIPALTLGIRAVFSRSFTKSRIWDICRKYGCTTFSLLGGMMMGIYSEPPRGNDGDNPVRMVLSAGTPASIWETFEKRFNLLIYEWYGAVEGGLACKPPGQGPVGSFGKPLPGLMEMKVVREDDSECHPGEIGELICRMVQGETTVEYHGNPRASSEKTRGGWLRTGDMCHRDADGWLFFDFRHGGGLRRQGDFIQPDYVEKVIADHPDVSEVCVYGVPAASGSPGESDLVAAVVPFAGRAVDPMTLFGLCLKGLEKNAVPSYIQVVDDIPKTISEKNLDRLLRDRFSPGAGNVYRLEDYK